MRTMIRSGSAALVVALAVFSSACSGENLTTGPSGLSVSVPIGGTPTPTPTTVRIGRISGMELNPGGGGVGEVFELTPSMEGGTVRFQAIWYPKDATGIEAYLIPEVPGDIDLRTAFTPIAVREVEPGTKEWVFDFPGSGFYLALVRNRGSVRVTGVMGIYLDR